MLPITLVIMLSTINGGAAINTALAYSNMQSCEKAALTINSATPQGPNKNAAVAALTAVCVEAGK